MAESFTDVYDETKWELSEEEYKLLKLKADKYDALIEFGVSNWEGYDEAMEDAAVMEDDEDYDEEPEEDHDDDDSYDWDDDDDDDDDLDDVEGEAEDE
jgi:hypothetical protein